MPSLHYNLFDKVSNCDATLLVLSIFHLKPYLLIFSIFLRAMRAILPRGNLCRSWVSSPILSKPLPTASITLALFCIFLSIFVSKGTPWLLPKVQLWWVVVGRGDGALSPRTIVYYVVHTPIGVLYCWSKYQVVSNIFRPQGFRGPYLFVHCSVITIRSTRSLLNPRFAPASDTRISGPQQLKWPFALWKFRNLSLTTWAHTNPNLAMRWRWGCKP